jgi:U3 small nucleolar RNA-associated protein 12
VALASNSLELLNIPLPPKSKDKTFTPEASRACILDLPGHRTDIRALALSEDDALLASCSNGQSGVSVATTVLMRSGRTSENLEYENDKLYSNN